MTGIDEGDQSDPWENDAHDDELAKKIARLTEEQKALYDIQVQNTIDQTAQASRDYQLKLADTLLKNLPPTAQAWDIKELNRQEYQRAFLLDQGRENERASQANAPIREALHASLDASKMQPQQQPGRNDPMQDVQPSGVSRDYAELQRTHERLAGQSQQGGTREPDKTLAQSQRSEPPTPSRDELLAMLEHYAQVRQERNLPHGHAEMQEQAKLSGAQFADRRSLEQAHSAHLDPQQREALNLLDHQHLAEQVGVQAKWLALDLKAQRSADAATYSTQSRQAFQTARLIHEQRQNQRPGFDRSEDALRSAQADHAQKRNHTEEVARGSRASTSEERSNSSADVRAAIDRNGTAARSKDREGQNSAANPGSSRTTGRGR